MKMLMFALVVFAAIASPAHANCGNQGVYLFSAHWCPACQATERFLTSNRVSYQRIEVTDNPRAQNFMRERFGTTAIPVVVVDGGYKLGYNSAWLQAALCLQ